MKSFCVPLILCLVVWSVQGKSIDSNLEVEDEDIKRIVEKVKLLKRDEFLSENCHRERWFYNSPFQECEDNVHDAGCDPALLQYCKDDMNKVSLQELKDLVQHVSHFSAFASIAVNGSAERAKELANIFHSTDAFYEHLDLADNFRMLLEHLGEASRCAFVPLWPIIFRMEWNGVEGVAVCDNMERTYWNLKTDTEEWDEPCDHIDEVVEKLTVSFKQDLQCLSQDVTSFHHTLLEVIDGIDYLAGIADAAGQVDLSHNEMMAYLVGLMEGVRRLYIDASFLHCGISEVLEIVFDYSVCPCSESEVQELQQEERKMKQLLEVLKEL